MTRLGVRRDHYLVSPGLYGIGNPTPTSPVVVTANYKLTFDTVRYDLDGQDVWLLVLDTCGVNVWCAAGKGTFSTDELVFRINQTGLADLIGHRKLIVPQLGATGVAAHRVKEKSGFSVIYGPVRSKDLPLFLGNDLKAGADMRMVTFSCSERAVLIPVELYLLGRVLWWIMPLLFIISGVGPSVFSITAAWGRGLLLTAATFSGIAGGALLVPLLLPYLPGKSFSLKGFWVGLCAAGGLVYLLADLLSVYERVALLSWVCCISSYLGMNFTGSTPYTSPSGVEWEMKRAIPLQLGAALTAAVLWIVAPFV